MKAQLIDLYSTEILQRKNCECFVELTIPTEPSVFTERLRSLKCFPSSGERTEHHHASACVVRQFHLHPLHPLRPPERLCEHPVPLRVWTQLHAWMMGFKELIVHQ